MTGKASTAETGRVLERRRAVALARHYRQFEGLSIRQIADRLGRSPATIKAYFYDPTGEKAKAVKARYVGVCRGCGAYTQPRNGKGDAYAYCKECHPGATTRASLHLLVRHYRELIPYGAGWTDPERQQPVGDTGRHEPAHADAIIDAELERALADPDPLRGIAQLTALARRRVHARSHRRAYPHQGALGSERMARPSGFGATPCTTGALSYAFGAVIVAITVGIAPSRGPPRRHPSSSLPSSAVRSEPRLPRPPAPAAWWTSVVRARVRRDKSSN